MTAPQRVQMTRQRPWRAEHPDAVIVARPSKWGNPWSMVRDGSATPEPGATPQPAWRVEHKDGTVKGRYFADAALWWVIAGYWDHLRAHPDLAEAALVELTGRDLACWCPVDLDCHADVLLEIANGGTE